MLILAWVKYCLLKNLKYYLLMISLILLHCICSASNPSIVKFQKSISIRDTNLEIDKGFLLLVLLFCYFQSFLCKISKILFNLWHKFGNWQRIFTFDICNPFGSSFRKKPSGIVFELILLTSFYLFTGFCWISKTIHSL